MIPWDVLVKQNFAWRGLFRLPKTRIQQKVATLNVLEERKFESFTSFQRYDFPFPCFSLGFGRFVLEKWQLSHGFAVDGAYSLGFGTVVSEKWRLSQGSAVEKPYSWDFGTFQSEHWPLSHGFAVGGACSLGFGTVKATILVTVVILAACFAVCAWSRHISRTPCTGLVWIN